MLGPNIQDWYTSFETLCVRKAYQAGDVILMQGEPADKIGFMLSGRAKASAYSENGDETWLAGFETHGFLGQVFDETGAGLPYEVLALTEVSLLFFPRSQLPAFLAAHPDFSLDLIKDINRQLDHMRVRTIEALTLSSKGRVCAELVRMSVPIGREPDKDIIRPNPVLVELAVRVSSTRETVSRAVNDLLKKGILSREPGALIVQSRSALRAGIK
ncbi:MAG: Crp/Fnr family transcriptional regulator [Maricaulaceae bacterium]